MMEKSSFAFGALERVPRVGARVLRTVDGFAETAVLSSAPFFGDSSDGREMVDSGNTQYTACVAKCRIASARRCSLSPICSEIWLSRERAYFCASLSRPLALSKSRSAREQSAWCRRRSVLSCNKELDSIAELFTIGFDAFGAFRVDEDVARVRLVVVVAVACGCVLRLPLGIRKLPILSSSSEVTVDADESISE